MAKLQMLSFVDDDILKQRIREESNYCDVAHLYAATYGISYWDGDTFIVNMGRPEPWETTSKSL